MLHKLTVFAVLFTLLFAGGCGKKRDEGQPPPPPSEQRAPESQQPPAAQPAQPEQKNAPSPGEAKPPAERRAPEPSKSAPRPEGRSGTSATPPVPPPVASKPAPELPPRREAPPPQEPPKPAPPPAAAKPHAQPPAQPIVLTGAPLGAVRFDHSRHKVDCAICHHPSREPRPASAPQQPCTACHTKPPQAGMTTGKQAAFHNPAATAGTCIDCHKRSGGSAPIKCVQCHKRDNR